ncbi:carboxylesterase family protein [Aquabacterium sp. A7-Y]|uniref:alpha/beta hydrolase n=1 Tax=Aquabacterium sp. A7-Y TaxID=1349605 RepID=UPI00223D0EEB|nr:alpha/beta hydrolase fold domain-containing protein [Aquabacterium sp. A7-Y]MCW7537670.1 carboxylesterase family protein [Aquabacterium sp. A7-Y]
MQRKPDPAWLNAQYSNRGRIPDYSQTLLSWAHQSAQARAALSRRVDVRYGDGLNETLDVFPTHRARAPVLVFLHGGWWRALDKADHSFIAPAFVEQGAAVVIPNFALCPVATIEQIVMQMVRALGWVARHIASYGGNPDRIVVAGHAAGAHLAAMLLSCRWADCTPALPAGLVKGALAISGLYDLEPLRQTPFLQMDLGLTPRSVRKLSPAGFPAPAVPLLAVVGALETEEFQRQNALIRAAWGPTAVPVCEVLPGAHHFATLDGLARRGSRQQQLALGLLHGTAASVSSPTSSEALRQNQCGKTQASAMIN